LAYCSKTQKAEKRRKTKGFLKMKYYSTQITALLNFWPSEVPLTFALTTFYLMAFVTNVFRINALIRIVTLKTKVI